MGIDAVLEWQHLSLKVDATSTKDESGPKEKTILDARSGGLVVLMGPSGAGKTSLLDCLAGRNRRATGRVTVNGTPLDDSMKALMAYVVEDDLFYETLTIMREFGLRKVSSSLIGGVHAHGISGGERKRLSLATDVLGDPSIFFVDEPKSGLDSFMAESVVMQLQRITQQGKTVLTTIHQSSSELFAHFDRLYRLGGVRWTGKRCDSVL
ncbi:hypothetical protein PF004_g11790 [Phytophthora fragariae]|uniref:ABC transporter domain-containing protein n=1 Tax=Phytophthora fragariae TaxID=53985 RepID=A0A6G0NX06_9STRA|nr:hypothetical protein PF004_g11790 [Phytophthora fragariae]